MVQQGETLFSLNEQNTDALIKRRGPSQGLLPYGQKSLPWGFCQSMAFRLKILYDKESDR